MPRRVYVYIPGIFTLPGEWDGWPARAVTWTHVNAPYDHAEKFEYFSGVLLRSLGQAERARKLAKMLGFYVAADWQVVLVAHSNGADVALDALGLLGQPLIERMHLFSPACDADCEVSGLALVRAASIHVYRAHKDWALGLAGSVVGQALGFGTLGRDGPVNGAHARSPVRVTDESTYGHTDWFHKGSRFELTMARSR
jgi:pimeloyl-ACP methyl ester carboxylesterase